MPISRRTRRRGAGAIAVSATVALGAGLLIGAAPVSASSGAGIVVSAVAQDANFFFLAPNVVAFRATDRMVESEIAVSRQGNTVVVSELEGGPSMGLEAPTDSRIACTASNPSGLSDEIRCTFGSDLVGRDYGVSADFETAPRGVTFGLDAAARMNSFMVGSVYDDYFQGGPQRDFILGKDGADFIFGGAGDDAIAGEVGDDVMYGDGEDEETGNDVVLGGPGDDYLEGGPGIDRIIGGSGRDEIDAKDGLADAEVDCNDLDSRGEESEAPRFDRGLDKPIDCGGVELPWAINTPYLSPTALIKPSTVVTATPPEWAGSTPMVLSYRWESCTVSAAGRLDNCVERAKGTLSAQGRDSRTGKAPAYTVTASDRKRSVRFVAVADNRKVKGGGTEEVVSAALPVGVEGFVVKDTWLPRKTGSTWTFASALTVANDLSALSVAGFLDIRSTSWRKGAVPADQRKTIKDGQVFSIRVNGKEVKARDSIDVADGARASVEIRYYSFIEDRKACPATDADLEMWRQQARSAYVDFQSLIDVLDQLKCPWAVSWSSETAPVSAFSVQNLTLEETDNPDRPVQVRISVRRPSTVSQLSIAVGAPPREVVAQSPDHFSLGLAGAVYAFPGTKFTALWTSLMGDQTRMPTKRARVQLFVNGDLIVKGEQGANFAYNLVTAFTKVGTARIVITTLNNDGSTQSQAYVDIPILDPASTPLGDLITWDGRCFNRDGSVASCAGRVPNSNAESMRSMLARSGLSSLQTYSAVDALRIASTSFNARFTPLVVNGPVPTASTAARSLVSPRSGCAWWDLGCHLRAVTDQVVRAVIKPKPTPKAPAPMPQPYQAKSTVAAVADGGALPVVTRGTVASVPGAGLIGLDGATLIGLDGATLISDQGGSLIGLDGATLIGLDGATLIGLDGATLIGLDGATLKPNQVSLPLIGLDGAT